MKCLLKKILSSKHLSTKKIKQYTAWYLPHPLHPWPERRAGNLWKLPHSHPATGSRRAQTIYQDKIKQFRHWEILTLSHYSQEVFLRRVLRHAVLEVQQLLAVFIVEPLHLEVQVHVIGALAQPVFLVFWETGSRSQTTGYSSQMCLFWLQKKIKT